MKVDSELWSDVNVVASVLKLFLRKLPRCLLTPGMSVIVILLLHSLFLCWLYLNLCLVFVACCFYFHTFTLCCFDYVYM